MLHVGAWRWCLPIKEACCLCDCYFKAVAALGLGVITNIIYHSVL